MNPDSLGPAQPPPPPVDARPLFHARITAPFRCLPTLLVIGAQKSGTSSLHALLHMHPQIWMTPWKECNVFTKRPVSRAAYRAFFLTRAERRRSGIRHVGESTPYYLFHPQAPHRAAATLPEFKTIAILRDPVQRAWSHYRHAVRLGLETRTLRTAIAEDTDRIQAEFNRVTTAHDASSDLLRRHSYLQRGLYAPQLQRWFDVIGRERVHVLFFEDLVDDFEPTLACITDFLDVDRMNDATMPRENQNHVHGDPISPQDAEFLAASFREANDALSDLLRTKLPWTDA